MNNFVQEGKTLTVIAPAAVNSGDVVKVGSLLGVAAYSAAMGAEVEVQVEGVFTVPKTVTDVAAAGAPLYWDAAAGRATVAAGTGSKSVLGYATKAAGNGVSVVNVKLIPGTATGPV